MSEARADWVRLAGAGGIVSVALVVAARLVAGSAPDAKSSTSSIVSYYASHTHWHRQEAGLLLGAASMVFFLWFLGGLTARLRSGERGDGGLSSALLAAGAAFAVLYAALSTMRGITAFALSGSHAFRAAGLDPQLIRSFEQARSLFFVFALVAGAVVVAASSTLSARLRVWPAWVSYAGLLVALLVLVGAFLAAGAVFLMLAWIVLVGAFMLAE